MREIVEYRCPYLGIYVNSYRVAAEGKTLLLDSGLACGRERLAPFANADTVLLSTHGHWDHIGNHRFLQSHGAKVYASAADARYFSYFGWHWDIQFGQFAKDYALPPARKETFFREAGEPVKPDEYLADGDILKIGKCTVEVLATPGHSDGSVCFLLADEGVLFTGDTLMGDGFFSGIPQYTNPIAYKRSMEKLMGLKVKTVYCDHNDPIPGERLAKKAQNGIACAERIEKTVDAFVAGYRGRPEALLQELVQKVCALEGKKAGSGACITVLAHLRKHMDQPVVKTCFLTHTPL